MSPKAQRVYLDWNATAPLRPEAREAMIAAMDVVGNPSSVHAEGRAARAIVERARGQVAAAAGATAANVVFTSGATEAAALTLTERALNCSGLEHDCVYAWSTDSIVVDKTGRVDIADGANAALQLANSETGVIQELPEGLAVSDLVQGFGKIPVAFDWLGVDVGLVTAHKLGGPKGVGALLLKDGIDLSANVKGGGQEQGRRAGTENVIGIAGFGAAAEAAQRDLDNGVWEPVTVLRDAFEARVAAEAPDAIVVGKAAKRLPNTSCIAVPGWKGETQVMQMDLAGFAISAGSACSSGKVKSSRVLKAMGFDDITAASAIRVSIGPSTTEAELMSFADAWLAQHAKFNARAA
ncbi:MAG: aminotransferase class V-fold PLP-dependent enzyme [Rhodobacteraceae bacterium]|nr:aminotransferase class V-fold PLP-dependent enzyme [Paracoccaceae bacterium]